MTPGESWLLIGSLIALAVILAGHAIRRATQVIDDALNGIATYWPEDADHRWARIRESFSPTEVADLITWEIEDDERTPALRDIESTVLAGWRDMPYDQEADQ